MEPQCSKLGGLGADPGLSCGLQGILKRHTLPRLVAAGQPGLWLNFVEKAVHFERQLAPLRGIAAARPAVDDSPELWRRSSCIAVVCSTQACLRHAIDMRECLPGSKAANRSSRHLFHRMSTPSTLAFAMAGYNYGLGSCEQAACTLQLRSGVPSLSYVPQRMWAQEFRDAWWAAEREEGLRQLNDALDAPSAWLPAHLAWDASVPDDWDDVGGGSERRCASELGGTGQSGAWHRRSSPPRVHENSSSPAVRCMRLQISVLRKLEEGSGCLQGQSGVAV